MSATASLSPVRGKLTAGAPLAPLVWFKSGGKAEWLFEPKDVADLQAFLTELDPEVPVMALGLGSNMIVRDGGVPGVVVRLGKPFGSASPSPGSTRSAKARSASTTCSIAGAGRAAFWFRRWRAITASPGSNSCARSPARSAASCG
jgi:hypothetical protein